MSDREFLLAIRQALLMALDALERKLAISPRTAEIRKMHKNDVIISNHVPEGSG
jgi:hypothetical protein